MSAENHERTEHNRRTQSGKNPNIHQVAALAKVSTATVSRVLDDHGGVSQELIDRVHEAVRTLDYHPNRAARNLRKRGSQTVGVVISDIQNPFFTSVISSIEKVLVEASYTLLLCNSDEDPKREKAHISTLRAEGVAGIILASTHANADLYHQLQSAGIPLVAIDRAPGQMHLDSVTVTNTQGAFNAVTHLTHLGHSRIGLITGPLHISTSRERLEGYEQGIRSHGLALIPELILFSNYRQAGGYSAMQSLLDLPEPPTAVLVANNLMTLGALQMIHERNLKIPDQIAIVGFDDMPWATSLQPPLTVVAQPTYELGTSAAQLLLDRLREPNRPSQHIVLETTLMVRASSGGHNALDLTNSTSYEISIS
ncbi:MAG: LacI family DNA-binding transcriptional regulator [Anaerolineaceae bacterium]|nr:LacI family DNA-binding transcriptional regulator [Anaerolineaceae bacterium]